MISVSIDKLMVLAMPDFSFSFKITGKPWIVKSYSIKYDYATFYNYNLIDGSTVIICHKYIRLAFNPRKCDDDIILYILNKLQIYKISRLDVALDYKHDLSQYFWFDITGRRKVNRFPKNNDPIETLYFGRPKSRLVLVIYNKAKESNLEGTKWRVEAKITNVKLDNILPIDMFQSIFAGSINSFPKKDSHLRRLLKHPEYMHKLSKSRRKKARELGMQRDNSLPHIDQPTEIYRLFRPVLMEQLRQYIMIPVTDQNYPMQSSFESDNDAITRMSYSLDD
ncbi:replication initiation factor [Geobacter sp. OR-1]|uniref:hypothetical protein n=1 Tax=Geobacter sp. OR-1 TaxID=1266765 RepID=UPI0005420220|nr:hypothetical protein [Geobacter sp. OR-1]GAM10422.1 replication initiation factor [Geobacter sp. OR-1]